jgi:uridylate kinase
VITYKQVFELNLNVMDMTAFTLCHENKKQIVVFNMNQKGDLLRLVQGENVGTLVKD